MQKCDVEYEEEANSWFSGVLKNLSTATTLVPAATPGTTGVKKTGKQVYSGTVLAKVNLNDRGSNKETWHIEIAAEGVQYQCGDSMGIVPENPTKVVEEILAVAKVDGTKKIAFNNEEVTMYDLLKHKINIIYLTERLVKQYVEITGEDIPSSKMDLLDLFKIYRVKDTALF